MGKGGNKDKKDKIVKKVESEEQEQHYDEEDEDDIDDEQDFMDDDDDDEDERLLKKIEEEIIGSDQPIKLTWAAIHSLKEQQKKMNEQMDQEMRKIQQKFDKLKEPLFHQIAKAASGEPIDKAFYKKHELTKSLSNKITPQKIPGFWVGVFESIGLFVSELDKQIFQKCTKVSCNSEKDDVKDEETINIELQFQQNNYFKNKNLTFVVHRKQTTVDIPQISRIEFKAPLEEESIIGEIFDAHQDPYKLYEYASDFLRAYNQSVFFYFFEGKLEDDELEALEAQNHNDDSEGEDDQDDQDDQSQEDQVGQPIKRRKLDKGNKTLQKPECNQQ